MKLSLPTVLAAACAHGAAALHINLYTSTNCNGPFFMCVNWTRNTCCDPNYPSRRFVSVEFTNLDRSRDWELRVYNGGGCTRRTATDGSGGRSSVCFVREPPYTGAGWGNFNRERDVEGGDDDAPVGCRRPQELGFPDGARFNLTFLSRTVPPACHREPINSVSYSVSAPLSGQGSQILRVNSNRGTGPVL
ncbi:uncharacterized protein LY79DRAFT_191834 [Colletotrichum navitas]|uniref:Uncharacterized protein n=1 Tax=Colletotrichum navitas TaxID=681940 RepID=A0AAD8PJ42_9PEZI|nr:uncharacterized protein LY79DRAFT_191834 [Colletotrichum navitas]KAK1561553.1 hypothetical protein LY79DRAFT_191834 [Colletotrichum navitas]